ncbi:MAG: PAS domain S-box protein [Bacteroidales bacterium]|nr:PAS domain S-box protein [Bacteroidales bacterium]
MVWNGKQIINFIVLLILLTVFASCSHENEKTAKKGVLDLSSWNIEKDGIVEITGEFEFYWNNFYTYTDFHNSEAKLVTIVSIPDVWNNLKIKGKNLPAYGYATYRLKLKTNTSLKEISLYIPYQGTAFELFQNDKSVLKCGNPTETSKNFSPKRENNIIHLQLDTNVNELIFHVSNYVFRDGGLWYPIQIGNEKQIDKHFETLLFSDIFLIGILFLITVFSLILSIFRKNDYASLFFAIFSFFILLRTALTNTLILEHFFQNLPYVLTLKLEYISLTGLMFAFFYFIKFLYPKVSVKTIDYFLISFILLYFIIIIVTSCYFSSKLLVPFQIVFVLSIFYAFFLIIKAIYKNHHSAKYILVGFIFVLISSLLDVLIANGLINFSFYISSYSVAIFIIFQLIALVSHILQVEKENINLESNLKTITQLNEIGLDITANLQIESILTVINQKINSFIQIDNLAIGLYSSDNNNLQFIGIDSVGVIRTGSDLITENKSLSVICFKNSENIFISDYSTEYSKYLPEFVFYSNIEYYQSLIYIPLKVKEKKIGVLTIQNKEKDAFTDFDLKSVENIALFASIAFDNANIYKKINSKEQELSAILETANEGIGMLDKRGYFTYVNNSLCEILGFTADEMLKLHYLSFLANKNDIRQLDFRSFIAGEVNIISSENQYIKKDGTKIWGKLSVKGIRNAKGKVEQIVGVFTDIDKLKQSELETKLANKKITASINYAKKIQTALMPTNEMLNQLFPDNFLLFRPKDIVSGDFYFAKKIKNKILLAVGDCTGHGVPGAMMSMLGISILNEIIRKADINNAAEVLEDLRNNVKSTLQQTGGKYDQLDGMDITFIAYNLEDNTLNFAGANSPLVILRKNKLIEIKGNNMPIAIYRIESPFTNHFVELEKNDTIYFYTDGYHSQLGNSKRQKFSTKRFKELLVEISHYQLEEQKTILEERLNQWQTTNKQTDDILIFGFKITEKHLIRTSNLIEE